MRKISMLRGVDQMENAKESCGKNLRDDFVKIIAKAYRPELVHRIGSQYL